MDIAQWDKFVSLQGGSIYSQSIYLDACADSWFILRDSEYRNAVAIPWTKKGGIEIVYQPIFWRQSHLFGDDLTFKDGVLAFLLRHYQIGHVALDHHSSVTENCSVVSAVYQQLESDFQFNTAAKRMIKKSVKAGHTFRSSDDYLPVLPFVISELKPKIKEFTDENIARLMHLFEVLKEAGLLEVITIYAGSEGDENQQIQGCLVFLIQGDQLIYLKGAAIPAVRDQGGIYQAMELVIHKYAERGIYMDFGGSMVEGVKRFYYNLGGVDQHYYLYTWDQSPSWYRLARRIYHAAKNVFGK